MGKNDINNEQLDNNLRIMEMVEGKLEQEKKDSIFCLLVFSATISVWILLVALWETLGRPIPVEHMTIGIEIIAAIMLLVTLKLTHLDIRQMGVNTKNLKPTIIRALIISAIVAVVMIVFKIVTKPDEPLFNWSKIDFTYPLTSVVQEFLSRGFLLTTIRTIVPSNKSHHFAVICSSLMFTSLHLFYGFYFMVGAGLLSIVLGYCYIKDENIWGVSIIHYVFGTLGVILEIVGV